jgi:ER lumen protein retaining receptor
MGYALFFTVLLFNSFETASFLSTFILLTLNEIGAYRALYIANWVYRYFTEPDYSNALVWVAGAVQTIIYLDFFYYYLQRYYS